MDIDDQLRRLYNNVFDVDLLDQAGQEDNHVDDPVSVRDLLCLELNQGGEGFRPCAFRFNFLNAMSSAAPQMLNSAFSRTNNATPGFIDFLSEWIGGGGRLAAHSQPALRTGLMAPAWRPALYI